MKSENIYKNIIFFNVLRNKKIELEYKQINNIYNFYDELTNKPQNKKHNYETLKKEMENNYNKISNNHKKFYVYNLLYKINKKTGEIIDNSLTNVKDYGNVFRFRDDFKIKHNIDNIGEINEKTLGFNEKNPGAFLQNTDKLYSYKKLSKVMYLEHMHKDSEKVFITFTLPSMYHKYTKKGVFLIENKNYSGLDFETNIRNGLELLNKIHRFYYQTLKKMIERSGEKKEIGFIKMLEPHKNLTGHCHSLFYVPQGFLKFAEHSYNLTIRKFGLEQTKYEILKNAKSSSYVQKYLIKTTNSDERFFNEYKRFFSDIRFFTSSNYKEITQLSHIDFSKNTN